MRRFAAGGLALLLVAQAPGAAAVEEALRPGFQQLEKGPDAAETFRLNALGIVSYQTSGALPTLFIFGGSGWRATRGKFRHATSHEDFFRLLGRDDLAARHRTRRLVSGLLIWGGLAAEVAGGVLFFTGLYESGFNTRAKVGLGLFVGGFAASAVGATVQHPPFSEAEAVEMAGEYNRRLQLHLGLVPALDAAARAPAPGLMASGRW